MTVVNVVQKFAGEALERYWALPAGLVDEVRGHVDLTDEGWIMHEWPVTEDLAKIVGPSVDEPIDVSSGSWFVGSWREANDV